MKTDPKPHLKVTPRRMLLAIPGTGGVMSRICARLGCSRDTAKAALASPSPRWDEVRVAYREEQERLIDAAEETVEELMLQRLDLNVASKNAWGILNSRGKHRGYANETKVVHEGGDKPIQIQQTAVPVDKLPLELRRQLLEQLERDEEADEENA